jgi:hypothetical protein
MIRTTKNAIACDRTMICGITSPSGVRVSIKIKCWGSNNRDRLRSLEMGKADWSVNRKIEGGGRIKYSIDK